MTDFDPRNPHGARSTEPDRFLPGGPAGLAWITVPPAFDRYVIEVRRRLPSMNDNTIRSNWRGFHKQKKQWQEEIETELMVAKMPRNGQRALVGAIVRFDRKMSRPPDPSNYRGLVDKACGDALVNFGAIPDDDGEHYFFGGVEFDPLKGSARTMLHIFLLPKGAQ